MCLKGIFILSFGFTFHNMAMTPRRCYDMAPFEWMLERCTPSRLIVGQCCTGMTSSYCYLGFILWNMAMTPDICYRTIVFEWMLERYIPPRLIVGPSILKLKCALHPMSMGDKSNIIDEAETFIFIIWLDELRGIYWEELWAYNYEPFTISYEMHVWMTWCFHEERTQLIKEQFLR